jgi:dephospho-CoA kinase
MKIIGITGGIGSGKTTVCKLFECLNVPVFYADEVGKRLMTDDIKVRAQVIRAFGSDSYIEGVLNRAYLSAIVFNHPEQLAKLNAIVHPAVAKATVTWVEAHRHHTYGLKEAAILFESGAFRHVDKVITVWAPIQLRIERVVQRDGVTAAEVQKRIDNQISEGLRLSLSDYVIENNGEQLLMPQVIRVHGRCLAP